MELETTPEISSGLGLDTESETVPESVEETTSEEENTIGLEVTPDPINELGISTSDEISPAEDSIIEKEPKSETLISSIEENVPEEEIGLELETAPDVVSDLNFEVENEEESGSNLSLDNEESPEQLFEQNDSESISDSLNIDLTPEASEEIDLSPTLDEDTSLEEPVIDSPEEEALTIGSDEALGLSDALGIETTPEVDSPDVEASTIETESKANLGLPSFEGDPSIEPEEETATFGESETIKTSDTFAEEAPEFEDSMVDPTTPETLSELVDDSSAIEDSIFEQEESSSPNILDTDSSIEEDAGAAQDEQSEEASLSNLFSEEPQKIEIPDYPPEPEEAVEETSPESSAKSDLIFENDSTEMDNTTVSGIEEEQGAEEANADHLIDVPENPFDVRVDFEADMEEDISVEEAMPVDVEQVEEPAVALETHSKDLDSDDNSIPEEEANTDHLIDVPEDPFDVRVDLESDEEVVTEEETSDVSPVDLDEPGTEELVESGNEENAGDTVEDVPSLEEGSDHLIDVPEDPFDVRVDFENDMEEDIFSEPSEENETDSKISEVEENAAEIEDKIISNEEEIEASEVNENSDPETSVLDEMDGSEAEINENSEDDEKQAPSFEEVIGLKPKNSIFDPENPKLEMPSATVTLAEIYFKQGLFEQSLSMYKNMLEDHPDDEKILTRIEEIKSAQQAKAEAEEAEAQKKLRPGGKKKKRPN